MTRKELAHKLHEQLEAMYEKQIYHLSIIKYQKLYLAVGFTSFDAYMDHVVDEIMMMDDCTEDEKQEVKDDLIEAIEKRRDNLKKQAYQNRN